MMNIKLIGGVNVCKCNMELISHIDNFSCLADFGCSDNFIKSLKGVSDEGYLYQCSSCGKFEYISEVMHDINMNMNKYTKEVEKLTQGQQELLNKYIIHEDITSLLQSEDIKNFLDTNGELIVNVKDWNDDDIYIYKLRDSFAKEFVYWKYVEEYFGKVRVYKISKSR